MSIFGGSFTIHHPDKKLAHCYFITYWWQESFTLDAGHPHDDVWDEGNLQMPGSLQRHSSAGGLCRHQNLPEDRQDGIQVIFLISSCLLIYCPIIAE